MRLMEPQVALSLKNILLAVDFSAASESAVRYARAIARRCLSDVHTVHVNGPDSYHLLPPEAFRVAVRDRQARRMTSSMWLRSCSRACQTKSRCAKVEYGR